MKQTIICLSVTLGLAMAIGTFFRNIESSQTPKEHYCEQLKVWHPDCKIE